MREYTKVDVNSDEGIPLDKVHLKDTALIPIQEATDVKESGEVGK